MVQKHEEKSKTLIGELSSADIRASTVGYTISTQPPQDSEPTAFSAASTPRTTALPPSEPEQQAMPESSRPVNRRYSKHA